MKLISLYTGAGGLDLGLERAGFETSVAVEHDKDAVVTLRANRPEWPVVANSIHSEEAASGKLLDLAGLQEGDAKLLCGGPPCQPFSKSGYWSTGDSKRLDDPRAKTLDGYLRVLSDTLPEVFLLENVPGMAFSNKAEGINFLRRRVEEINREKGVSYSFRAMQLNAGEYGVPQLRKRVFVIGHREGKELQFPEPTHALPPRVDMANGGGASFRLTNLELNGLIAPATAWDAIGHLQDDDDPALLPTGKYATLHKSVPEGHNYLYFTPRGGYPSTPRLFGWRTRYWSMLLKLAKNRPSWTLTAKPGPAIGPFHWKSRRLSAAELCGLQTFPPDYRIVGNVRSAHKQVGNAVPSAMAEILGLCIRQQFFGHDVDPTNPTLLPKRRRTPAPEEPVPCGKHWWDQDQDHEEHRGTGQGNGARKRRAAASTK